jgi:hypothetical protein
MNIIDEAKIQKYSIGYILAVKIFSKIKKCQLDISKRRLQQQNRICQSVPYTYADLRACLCGKILQNSSNLSNPFPVIVFGYFHYATELAENGLTYNYLSEEQIFLRQDIIL